MEELSVDYCRICLRTQGSISIFDKVNDLLVSEIFFMVFGITLENDRQIKDIPRMCCGNCLQTLMAANKLKQVFLDSDRKIKDFYQPERASRSRTFIPRTVSKTVIPQPIQNVPKPQKKITIIEPTELVSNIKIENPTQNSTTAENSDNYLADTFDSFEDFSQISEKNVKKPVRRKPAVNQETPCRFCNKIFPSAQKTRKHEDLTHLLSKDYICDLCGRGFVFKSPMKAHIESVHLQVKSLFICETCGKVSNTKALHLNHLKVHDPNSRKFCCPHEGCSAKLTSKHILMCHLRTHTGEKPYLCETCSKEFRVRSNYMRHLKSHARRENPLPCSYCPKTFLTLKVLQAHEFRHTQPKEPRKRKSKKETNPKNVEVRSVSYGEFIPGPFPL